MQRGDADLHGDASAYDQTVFKSACGEQSLPSSLDTAEGSGNGHGLEQTVLHKGRHMTQADIKIQPKISVTH